MDQIMDIVKEIDESKVLELHPIKKRRSSTWSSGLPLKRVSRPARILQSPFVSSEGKHSKSSDNIIVFHLYNQHSDDVDVTAVNRWFHRGYKPTNK
ncbi:Hypothetical predicted protein [Olea europaea subsp. europaea]|uniref:Uncharacterized protein n=1 Tax=Olea europaea subsp. europaea TaxID=158383 RepID=A0A8S0PZB5_OLEEU|nr:Hypothetical predicted protein [Olea europaea subsp. europaea]